jgi:hypothetical protein
MREHRYVPGMAPKKVYGPGCECEITWELKDGQFSMSAGVWMRSKQDLLMCGQCVDKVAGYFPNDKKAQRMKAIWERWHLNGMNAGSAVQEQWLRDHPIDPAEYAYPKSHYVVASAKLAEAGLNPDPDGYTYGHAWKREEIPADIIAEIQSWV